MAKRTQTGAAKSPPRKSREGERWWKAPAVIAALIGAVAAVTVAYIQFIAPKPKSSAPTSIQQTHGEQSPAITGTGGDVIINQRQDEKRP
jgi:hypothetical protein